VHRAWKRSLSLGVLVFSLASPGAAAAYHVGSTFDKAPGAGGGGGIFYAGAKLERGWDCAMCHIEPEGKIKVRLNVDPPALFDGFQYTPGETYTFTATLEGEHLGKASPLSNYNGLVVELVDGRGFQAGSLGGFAAEDFYSGFPATIASAGTKPNVTQWTFAWTAPAVGTGKVSMHVAAVDGNGADSGPGATLTDPFHDDVFVATIEVSESPMGRRAPTGSAALACAMGIVLLSIDKRRRAKRS